MANDNKVLSDEDLKDIATSLYLETGKELEICFHPKCEEVGYCTEKRTCGKMPRKE